MYYRLAAVGSGLLRASRVATVAEVVAEFFCQHGYALVFGFYSAKCEGCRGKDHISFASSPSKKVSAPFLALGTDAMSYHSSGGF